MNSSAWIVEIRAKFTSLEEEDIFSKGTELAGESVPRLANIAIKAAREALLNLRALNLMRT